jgi:hypothetical protein
MYVYVLLLGFIFIVLHGVYLNYFYTFSYLLNTHHYLKTQIPIHF